MSFETRFISQMLLLFCLAIDFNYLHGIQVIFVSYLLELQFSIRFAEYFDQIAICYIPQ